MAYNNELKFNNLSQKVVVLLLILATKRKQALMSITVDNVILYDDNVVLIPNKILQYSAPHCPLEPFVYNKYAFNEKLCIVNHIRFYLKERNRLVVQKNQNLILTFGKPHRNASSDMISRWVKEEPLAAGIDITCFKIHKCRAVCSSTGNQIGISLKEILKRSS